MLTKRVIACLDVLDGRVVKGTQFRNHEDVGDILELSKRYCDQGVDELVFYDITASSDGRTVDRSWINGIARVINIPFCVAGGIRTIEDARIVLNNGADKISVNSPASATCIIPLCSSVPCVAISLLIPPCTGDGWPAIPPLYCIGLFWISLLVIYVLHSVTSSVVTCALAVCVAARSY